MSQQKKLEQGLGALNPERFFVAGMACLLVGAAIANGLGLVKFDTVAMQEFLVKVFKKLREDRASNLPIAHGYFDIERVFGDFIADNSADRLITDVYLKPGPNQEVKVVWSPRKLQGRLAIHIARDEKRIRIDKIVWRAWCYNHGFSPTDVTMQLERRWGAKITRAVLGAGTDLATGRVEIIEIPLVAPELADYNYSYSSRSKK